MSDLRPGTVWWRVDGLSDVCSILDINPGGSGKVRVQFLNNRRYKRFFPLGEFEQQWTFRPRIDLAWLNAGSIWRRINYKGKVDRKNYTLSRVHRGFVVLFTGKPGHYREAQWDFKKPTVLTFAQNYVRLWPDGAAFPIEPVAPVQKRPSRDVRKTSIKCLTFWDRLSGNDIV